MDELNLFSNIGNECNTSHDENIWIICCNFIFFRKCFYYLQKSFASAFNFIKNFSLEWLSKIGFTISITFLIKLAKNAFMVRSNIIDGMSKT